MEFKEGKRFERKEDLLGKDGYIEMEKKIISNDARGN
jgi:hypothetical protein